MRELTLEQAKTIVANKNEDELAALYLAAYNFWKVVRQTNDHHAWLKPAAAIGAEIAPDNEME